MQLTHVFFASFAPSRGLPLSECLEIQDLKSASFPHVEILVFLSFHECGFAQRSVPKTHCTFSSIRLEQAIRSPLRNKLV